jgi:hypothetical protein
LIIFAAGLFGLGSAGTWIALGIRADRAALAVARAQDAAAVWMEATDRFERTALADPFLLPVAASGNAAEIYWGAGAHAGVDCPLQYRLPLFGDAAFQRWPEAIANAAGCPGLDEIVKAAGLPQLDLSAHIAVNDPEFDLFATGDLFRKPEQALYALLARAHARIEKRDFANAERDARAVVSAGRQFLWQSPDLNGAFMGISLMTAGLDHLRELHERTGNARLAAAATEARDSLHSIYRGMNKVLTVAQSTSTFPSLLRYTVAAAENEGLPLGMRSTLVVFLGYGHIGHSTERLLWPSRVRARALARLERQRELLPAVVQARKGLALSWFERKDLATQWDL